MPLGIPFAWLGIVIVAGTRDSIRPRLIPIFPRSPEGLNEFGHFAFALPAANIITLPTVVTSWIGHLPDDLPFRGQKNPHPLEDSSWMISFEEPVIVISDGKTNQCTRFLKVNEREVPIHTGDDLECVIAAFGTERKAHVWTEQKTAKLILSHREQPS